MSDFETIRGDRVCPVRCAFALLFSVALLGAESALAAGITCAGYTPPPASSIPEGPAAKVVGRTSPLQPGQGHVNVLVVFAQFENEAPNNNEVPSYASRLFSPDIPGSFTHFYNTMSHGQLLVRGTVLPLRYRSEHPASEYLALDAGGWGQYGRFAREILEQVDDDVDLRQFDNDGPDGIPDSGDDDGLVDYTFIDLRSVPSGFLRGGATGVAGLGLEEVFLSQDVGANGTPIKIVDRSATGSILEEGSFAQTVGTMAHEFGHGLGLPDLFDTSPMLEPGEGPAEDSAGIGAWGLMGWGAHGWGGDDGPNPLSARSLEQLGWIGRNNERMVEVAVDATDLALDDLYVGGSIYKVHVATDELYGTPSWVEYLLLEQRTRAGTYYNRNMPAEGLLVWHVRLKAGNNQSESDKLVDLVCADGLYGDAGYPVGLDADSVNGSDNLDFWAHDALYASKHAGNKGDATDPFDGIRFLRLDLNSNPGNNPQGRHSAASSGVSLSMRRQDGRILVDARQPRWAGTITEVAHWRGSVLVEGDLEVAPEGKLVIERGTQVRFSRFDRLQSGLDPTRIELNVKGDLTIGRPPGREKVILEAMNPGHQWYGILFNPSESSKITIQEGWYELRDVERGFVFPGAPLGIKELAVNLAYRVIEAPGPAGAGNGDGRFSPGESFQVTVDLNNWSLENHNQIQVTMDWDSALARPTWESDFSIGNSDSPEPLDLTPGGWRHLELPSLTLSPDATAGQRIELAVDLTSSRQRWSKTLAFEVEGSHPVYEAEIRVPDHEIRDGSVLWPAGKANPVQAHVRGEIDGVDLVVLPPFMGGPTRAIPMALRSHQGDLRVFEADFQPDEPDLYQLQLRIHGSNGQVVFGPSKLHVLGTPFSGPPPLLVFLGHGSTDTRRNLRQLVREIAAEQGLEVHIVDSAPEGGRIYPVLLSHLGAEITGGSTVLWLGQEMDSSTLAEFRLFLGRGGRAGFLSPRLGPSARQMLHTETPLRGARWGNFRSIYLEDPIEFAGLIPRLRPVAPAVPVLLDEENAAGGLRVDTGTYRLVYLPFDLSQVQEEVARGLLGSSLLFLHQRDVEEVELVPVDRSTAEHTLLVQPEQTFPLRAVVRGTVARAELVVRSFPHLDVVAISAMQRTGEQEGSVTFEVDFAPPDPGHYQLSLRLYTPDGKGLFSSEALRVTSVRSERPVLVLLGDQYNHSQKRDLRAALNEIVGSLGLEASFVDLVDEGAQFYQALLDRHLAEGRAVIWLGGRIDIETQSVFRHYMEGGGRMLIVSRLFTSSVAANAFLRDILHTESVRPTSARMVRSLAPGNVVEAGVFHSRLAPLFPAVPVLLNNRDQVAGLQVAADGFRLVYLPFDLDQAGVELLRPLLEYSLRFLDQDVQVQLEMPGHEIGDFTLVLPHESPTIVRARITGAVAGADLVVRSWPRLDLLAELPMERVDEVGEAQIYEALFQPPEFGQVQFSLNLHGPDGQDLYHTASQRVMGFSADNPILVFLGEQYDLPQKQELRLALGESIEQLGAGASFVDLADEDAEFIDGLLGQLPEEGGLVVWLGAQIDEEIQSVFRHFMKAGGRMLIVSRRLDGLTNSSAFLPDILHSSSVRPTSTLTVRSVSMGEPVEFEVPHSRLEPLSPAVPVLVDERGQVAGLQVAADGFRLVFLPFDLDQLEAALYRPLIDSSLRFLREQEDLQVRLEVPGYEVGDVTLVLPAEPPTLVRARITGRVAGADLVVRSWPQLALLDELPMVRVEGPGETKMFEVAFQPPASVRVQLSLKLHGADGRALYQSASQRVLGFAAHNPILAFLGEQYDPSQKEELRRTLADSFTRMGLGTSFIDLADEGAGFFESLLGQYREVGRAVVWLGRIDVETKDVIRPFLEGGGRMLIVSRLLGSSLTSSAFRREILHSETVRPTNTLKVRALSLGDPIEFEVWHSRLDPLPPAVPVLLDGKNQPAGLRVSTDEFRLVYFPFDLDQLEATLYQPLVESSLRFLRQSDIHVQLEVPGHAVGAESLVLPRGRPALVRARIKGEAELRTDLVVRSMPEMELVAQMAMARVREGEEQIFEVEFQPSASGPVQLSLRLRSQEGEEVFAEPRLLVWAFASDVPALVLLGYHYQDNEKEELRASLARAFAGLAMEAVFVDQPEETGFLEGLLDLYLDPGELVVWTGETLDEESQATFRRFLERGGRLLMASSELPFSAQIRPFMQDVLHLSQNAGTNTTSVQGVAGSGVQGQEFVVEHSSFLDLLSPAEPLWQDSEGRVAGMRLDSDVHRLVYLAFDLADLESEAREALLASHLSFLYTPELSGLGLAISQVEVPDGPTRMGALAWPVVVDNTRQRMSEGFRVGYQILYGDEVVASVSQEEAPLEGGSQRTVDLPPWEPSREGDFRLLFGLAATESDSMAYGLTRRLQIVAVAAPFELVELPAEASRGNGAGFFDYDGDGDLDLYLVRLDGSNRLFRNDDGIFSERARQAGLDDAEKGRGLALGDYDGDGDLDLYLVNESANRFFRNLGDGTFADVAAQLSRSAEGEASLADDGSGRSAGFLDYDLDGDLDLYLVNARGPNRFYRNVGGAFSAWGDSSGLADKGDGRGLAIGDYDGDGDDDVLVANRSGLGALYRNDGDRFHETDELQSMTAAEGTTAAVFADYDNDGDLDVFLTNESGPNHLYRNEAELGFQCLTSELGLYLGERAVGAGFYDYDNDGDLDLVTTAVNPAAGGDELYQNMSSGALVPVGPLLALASSSNGRALSFADYDGDGDLDLFIADYDRSHLYRNPAVGGNWLQVDLDGQGYNRRGVGAWIWLVAGDLRLRRQVQSSFGYASQTPSRLHLGLGPAARVDSMWVLWPDGKTTLRTDVRANQIVRLTYPRRVTAILGLGETGAVAFELRPNYPNPFNAKTRIPYYVPRQTLVELAIYNIAGQQVRRLVGEVVEAGNHTVTWDGLDDTGGMVGSGVYLFRMRADRFTHTRRLAVVK